MIKKLFLHLVLFALLPSAAVAQFTTVSGTVTDPNSIPYAYGTITPLLVASGTPTFTSTGSVYIPPTQPIGLSSAGSFTVQLANAASLTPSGTTWSFTVCSALGTVQPAFGKGPVCFTVSGITLSGSTQSLTSTLTSAAVALTFGTGGGGGVGGSGTISFLPEWSATTTVTNSPISDSGTLLTSTRNLTVPILNTTTGFEVGGAAPNGHCLVGNGTNYVDNTCPAGSSTLNSIGAATASGSPQGNGNFSTTWNWALTSTTNGLNLGETSASTGTGSILSVVTGSGSTATPLNVDSGAAANRAMNVNNGWVQVGPGSFSQPVISAPGAFGVANGLFFSGANNNAICFGDEPTLGTHANDGCMDDQGFRMGFNAALRWTSTTITGNFDTCLDRVTAGIIGIDTTGPCNTFGYAGALQLTNVFNYGALYFPATAGTGITTGPLIQGLNANVAEFCITASCSLAWASAGPRISSSGILQFTNGGLTNTVDSGISRGTGPAILDVGNGSAGDFSGTLQLTTLNGKGTNGGYVGVDGTGANVTFAAGSSGFFPSSTGNCIAFNFNGVSVGCGAAVASSNAFTGTDTFTTIGSATNCSSAASPAVCGSSMSGSVVVAAAASTVVVNTSAVTANSQIIVTEDASLGTKLSVTCNTNLFSSAVTARTAATSFTITLGSSPATNPACLSYTIIN